MINKFQVNEFQGETYYFLYGVARKLEDIQTCDTTRLFTNMYKYLTFVLDNLNNRLGPPPPTRKYPFLASRG